MMKFSIKISIKISANYNKKASSTKQRGFYFAILGGSKKNTIEISIKTSATYHKKASSTKPRRRASRSPTLCFGRPFCGSLFLF